MGDNDTPNPDPSGLTPNGSDLQGLTPNNPSGLTPNGTEQKTPLDSLPLDVQLYIKDKRKDEEKLKSKLRELEESQRKREQAEQAEVQKRLQEQGEWQKLAEQHKADAQAKEQELAPLKEEHEMLKGLVSQQIATLTKDWPKSVKDLIPDETMPIAARYAQVQKLATLAQELQEQPQTKPGNAPNKKPAAQKPGDLRAQFEQQLRSTGKY